MNADDRYVVISADCHGGGEIHEYRDFLASQVPRRVRRLGRRLPDPVHRPPRRPRRAQLGLRPSHARPRGRRHRRRSHLPEHDPAVLPRRRAGDAGTAGRRARPRAALGGAAGAQPLARRLLRAHTGTTRRHRADPAPRRRRVGRGDPLGARPTGSPAASSCPARLPASGCCRSTTSSTTRSGRCARSSACRSTTTVGARARARGPEQEDIVMFLLEVTWWSHNVLTNLIVGGALERHPDLQFVFTEQGTGWVPDFLGSARLLLRSHAQRGRLAGTRVGPARRREAGVASRASTGPASATSARASSGRRRCRSASRSASTASCGGATTRTRSRATRSRRRRSGSASPVSTRSRCR